MWLPSAFASSTAVTVTLCGTFQLALVKVTLLRLTVTWASGVMLKLTSAEGWVVSTRV